MSELCESQHPVDYMRTSTSPDRQSIYIGVPVPRGYRRKRRRRRSSREASGVGRSRHQSQARDPEDGRYRDADLEEEGLTDSNEQSLHRVSHSGESRARGSLLWTGRWGGRGRETQEEAQRRTSFLIQAD